MKKNIIVAVILFSLIVLTACGSSQPEVLTTVRINGSRNISHAPIFIADYEGYFAEFGIQLEMIDFNRTTEAIPLVLSGDLDVLAGGIVTGLLNTLGLESDIKVVADRGSISSDMDCSFQAILVRKDLFESGAVSGPADLKGLRVVSSMASPSEFLLGQYLSQAELTLDDVIITDLPKASYIDAMENKTVDIIVAIELNLSQLLSVGDAVNLVGLEDVAGDYQTSVLAFGKNLLVRDPELGVRFLAGYMKGVAQYNQGKTERNLEIVSEATGQDIEVVKNACWIPISPGGIPNFSAVLPFMNWAIDKGYLDQAITEEQFWDPDFLEAAKDLLQEKQK